MKAPTSLFNRNTGQIGQGAVGSRASLFRFIRREVQLIKIDAITGEPELDKNGFCKKVRTTSLFSALGSMYKHICNRLHMMNKEN